MSFIEKITNIDNLFKIHPSTDFSYTFHIIVILIAIVIATYAYDFYAKNSNDKYLKKAMKWRMTHFRWTFPLIAVVMLISRIEWIPILNMKFWWIIWAIAFIIYSVITCKRIKKEYNSKLKNKERFGT